LAFSLGLEQSPGAAQKGAETGQDRIEKIETDLSREKEQFLKFHERERELLQLLTNLEAEIAAKRKSMGELSEKVAQKSRGGLPIDWWPFTSTRKGEPSRCWPLPETWMILPKGLVT